MLKACSQALKFRIFVSFSREWDSGFLPWSWARVGPGEVGMSSRCRQPLLGFKWATGSLPGAAAAVAAAAVAIAVVAA